jgi:hypothetical protein
MENIDTSGRRTSGRYEPSPAFQFTPQDDQLMSENRILRLKPQLRLEWRGKDGQNETEQPDHSASLGDSITSSTRIGFSVHTRRVWKDRAPEWREAYDERREGSTFRRARIIGNRIFVPAASIPDVTPSPERNLFLKDVVEVVQEAAAEARMVQS